MATSRSCDSLARRNAMDVELLNPDGSPRSRLRLDPNGSPGSRFRITPRSPGLQLPITIAGSPRISEPDFDKLSKEATTLSEDLDDLRNKIRRMDVPKISVDVHPPGSQLISTTNPALSTIASSVLNDKVDSIRYQLVAETRERRSADDEISRRLRILDHKMSDLELRCHTLELERDTVKKENAHSFQMAMSEIARANKDMDSALKEDIEKIRKDSALKEDIEKIRKELVAKAEESALTEKIEKIQQELQENFQAIEDEIQKVAKDRSGVLEERMQSEEEIRASFGKDLSEESLKKAQSQMEEKVKDCETKLKEHIEQVRNTLDSKMTQDLDNLKQKTSEDLKEKDKKGEEKTKKKFDEFEAKLQTKVESTKLNQEIQSLETKIQDEKKKREDLEKGTRDHQARLGPVEDKVADIQRRSEDFIHKSRHDIEEDRRKGRDERDELRREAREHEKTVDQEMTKHVQDLEQKFQSALSGKVAELELQNLKTELNSRLEKKDRDLRQELTDRTERLQERTDRSERELKDRVNQVETYFQKLRQL